MRVAPLEDPLLHAALVLALAAAGCVRSQPRVEDPTGSSTGEAVATTPGIPEGDEVSPESGAGPQPSAVPSEGAPEVGAPESGASKPWSEACRRDRLPIGPGVTPAAPFDGWVVRARVDSRMKEEVTETEIGRGGAPCSKASDAASCEAALVAPMPDGALRRRSYQTGSTRWQGVATAGDRVERIVDLDGLKRFLGPIDAGGDAIAVVWAMGYEPTCLLSEPGAGGFVVGATRQESDCPITNVWVKVTVGPDASTQVVEVDRKISGGCVGRLPVAPAPADRSEGGVAGWLAHAAWLEAQAVFAFEHLERELRHHGAPKALIDACVRAQAEEARHARLVGELAHARGVPVSPARADDGEVRSLLAIALDNAVEGLVRETWGAAVGLHQAERAADPDIRRLMAAIAPDEVQHAAFSRALHRWLLTRLSPEERARVEACRIAAWRSVAVDGASEPAVAQALGLPPPAAVEGMVRVLAGLGAG